VKRIAPYATTLPASAPPAPPALEEPYLAGRYFTNGAALYRVVRWRNRPAEPPLAEVEDCATLHLALLTHEDLVIMALRHVALTDA